MKKTMIACALVLSAIAFSSCGDTNRCYEVTLKVNSAISLETTTYFWGTKNELDTYKDNLKAAQIKLGIDEKTITISSKPTTKSQSDCH